MIEAKSKIVRVLQSPWLILVTLVIAIVSMSIALQAIAIAADEANRRAEQLEAQAVVLKRQTELLEEQNRILTQQQLTFRYAMCGLVEPFAAAPTPATDNGKTIHESFGIAKQVFACTPDPTDRQ